MSSKVINFTLSKELKHTELGKTLVKKQLFSEAFDHFKTAIKENKNQGIEILIFLYKINTNNDITPLKLLTIAKVYLELQFAQEAFDVIEELLEEWPTNEATYDLLAKLATKKQLTKKVKLIFEKAINNNIFYPSIISILPTIYLDEKNYSNAITLYETLIEEFPNEYHYYKVLSELYFRKRDYESASEVLSKLISLAPFKSEELIQPTEQILRKIPRHSSVRKLFANILFRAFKPEEACQQINILLNYHPHQKETAIGILKQQNESFPNHPEILHLIADLLIETQSYTESLGYIESLLEASPLQSDKALVLMNKIIQVFPNHCLALEIIGNIYFQQENFIQALHYYNQCVDHLEEANDVNFLDNLKEIQSNPESTSQNKASLIIAKILTKSQQKEEALSIISTLANTDVDIDANLLKISLLNQFKDFNQSQNLLSELVKKQPFQWNIHTAQKTTFYEYITHELSNETSSEESSEKALTKASLLLANQELSKAIKLLQKIHVNAPLYFDSQQMIARAFFELSRYDLAIQIYERLVKSYPDYPNIKALYYWTGLSQLLLSNEEDALQSFETLATYDQNFLQTTPIITQLQKQKFLNHNGLVATGCLLKNDFQIIIRKNHFGPQKKKNHQFEVIGFSQSYNDEGCKQLIKQQYKAARESFELAIQMDPKFHIAHINMAFLNLIEKKLPEAIKHITLAESITTNCPYTYYVKSIYTYQKDDIESAIRYTQQAIKLQSKEGLFYIMLGDLLYKQFNLELATTYWKKATEGMDLAHLEQQRFRIKHMNKINTEYWISPEFLSFR